MSITATINNAHASTTFFIVNLHFAKFVIDIIAAITTIVKYQTIK